MSIAGTIAKNTTFGIIQSIAEIGISFVVGIVLARNFGTEQYGLYAYLMWFLTLTGFITNLGLGEMSRRFIPEAAGRRNLQEPAGYAQITLILRSVASVIVCFGVIATSGYWAQQSGDSGSRILFIIVALTAIPDGIQMAFIQILKGFQRFDYSLYISLAMYPLRLVAILVLINLGYGLTEVIILNIATPVLGVLVGFFLLGRLMPLKNLFLPSLLSSDTRKRALRYAITVAGTLILGYLVNNQAEVFFIGMYCPVEEVGFYNLAFRLATTSMSPIPLAMGLATLPTIAEHFGRGENEKIKRIYLTSARYFMLIGLPLAFGGIALSEPIIVLLYGADYLPTVILMQILILPISILGITYAADSVIRGINRPGFLLKTMIVFAVIKIGLSLWLIPQYGVLGAAIAASVPQVLGLPVYVVFIARNVRVNWPLRDTLKIVGASLVMGAAVYLVKSQLSVIPSLVLGIPLGLVIYIAAILALRVIKDPDIIIFGNAQSSLPAVLRKPYLRMVELLERIVTRTTGPAT